MTDGWLLIVTIDSADCPGGLERAEGLVELAYKSAAVLDAPLIVFEVTHKTPPRREVVNET